MNLNTNHTLFTQTNSEWVSDLNVKLETTKLPEDNIGQNIDDFEYGSDF